MVYRREEKLKHAADKEALERLTPEDELKKKLTSKNNAKYVVRDIETFAGGALIHHAHALYLNYATIEEIYKLTSIDKRVISFFVYKKGGWKEEREKLETDISEEVKKSSLDQLRRINVRCLDLVEQGLSAFKKGKDESGEPITLSETRTVVNIWKKVHEGKMLEELDASGATILSLGPRDVLKAFKQDPYLGEALGAIDITPPTPDEETKKQIGDGLDDVPLQSIDEQKEESLGSDS